ncbi:MAG: hypothetical protein ACRD0M_07315, partial [Acidimicrobiales bacterium]
MRVTLAGTTEVVFTTRADGDLAPVAAAAGERHRAVVDLPWRFTRQVHGARVVGVAEAERRPQADAIVALP